MNGLTANYNNYSSVELEKSLQSWVEPYPKPIILNHDLNSEPIGRVIAAKMDKEQDGAPYVRLQIAITDPSAAQKISDKRYLTGSVGGRAGKAVCSISGEDLAAESSDGRPKMPKYKRGQIYKGKLAFVDMQEISFKEYSFVNQPADQRSSVRTSKSIDGSTIVKDADTWAAKSSAFVLHMDKEDITTVEENESILKGMKKKESRPLYLHLKGAFLTAVAFQESETAKADNTSLLSEENIIHEENVKMDETVKSDDVLATVENLSQDLTVLATAAKEETPTADAAPAEDVLPKEETPVVEEISNPDLMSALVAALEIVKATKDQSTIDILSSKIEDLKKSTEKAPDAEIFNAPSEDSAKRSDEETAAAEEQSKEELVDSEKAESSPEKVEQEESKTELTGNTQADEQNDNDNKLQVLQTENAKLREALHRTLAERVVDTKISLGLELVEQREQLIKDHAARSAGSLADSLRDLAKLPIAKKNIQKLNVEAVIDNYVVSEKETNVIVEDEEMIVATPEDKVDPVEELFVDALMGRRKL